MMIETLTSLILSAVQSLSLAATPVQTCVWPNRCAKDAPVLAQFQPCVWPNKCSKQASGLI